MKSLMVAASAAALLAASTLTAVAAEAAGMIAGIDVAAGTVTLDDGKVYNLPMTVAFADFKVGQKVMIRFEDRGGTLAASAISPAAPAGADPRQGGNVDPGIAGPGAPRGD